MYKYITRNHFLIYTYSVFIIISSTMSVLFSFVLSNILNGIIDGNIKMLFNETFLGITFVLATVLSEYICGILKNTLQQKAREGIKNDLLHSLLSMKLLEYEKMGAVEYTNDFIQNLDIIDNLYFDNLLQIPSILFSFIFAIVVCLYIEPIMLLIIILLSVLSTFIIKQMAKRLEKSTHIFSESTTKYNNDIINTLNGFKLIKSYGITSNIEKKHSKINFIMENDKKANSNERLLFTCINETIGLFITILIMSVSGYFAVNGRFEIGYVLAFGQLSGKIISPIMSGADMIMGIKSSKGILKKYQQTLEASSSVALKINKPTKAIYMNDICFNRDNKAIITEFNYQFENGGKYLITGENGKGKSTLAMLIAGIYEPSDGTIDYTAQNSEVNNYINITDVITYVDQDAYFINDTVYNNLTLYNEYSMDEVENAITKCGLDKFIQLLPDGLNHYIDDGGQSFSGGERQKLNLARALLRDSNIIIFDEVTAHLDAESTQQIEELICNLSDKTIISISHKIPEALKDKYDHIITL